MKKNIISLPKLFITTSLVLTIGVCSAQSKSKSSRSGMNMNMAATTDTGFVRKNIMDNMMEIRLSEIGRDASTSDSVKALATQMITDHTQILDDLTTIGGRLGAAAPDTTNMPTGDATAREDFDKTWLNQMLVMHQAKVKELQMAAPMLKDPALKAAAKSALPKIQLHTQMLQRLAATAGKK